MPTVTSVTIRYRDERDGYTVNVSTTFRPKPKKREPKKAPKPKTRPER